MREGHDGVRAATAPDTRHPHARTSHQAAPHRWTQTVNGKVPVQPEVHLQQGLRQFPDRAHGGAGRGEKGASAVHHTATGNALAAVKTRHANQAGECGCGCGQHCSGGVDSRYAPADADLTACGSFQSMDGAPDALAFTLSGVIGKGGGTKGPRRRGAGAHTSMRLPAVQPATRQAPSPTP